MNENEQPRPVTIRDVGGPLFLGVSDNTKEAIAASSTRVTYPPKQSIYRHIGAQNDPLYLVVQGTAELSLLSPTGGYILFRTHPPGSVFGELENLTSLRVFNYVNVARANAGAKGLEVIRIPWSVFRNRYQADPVLNENLIGLLTNRMVLWLRATAQLHINLPINERMRRYLQAEYERLLINDPALRAAGHIKFSTTLAALGRAISSSNPNITRVLDKIEGAHYDKATRVLSIPRAWLLVGHEDAMDRALVMFTDEWAQDEEGAAAE